MTDCIHGLEADRCDLCTPRQRAMPAPSARATKPTRARAQGSVRAGGAGKQATVDPGTRRIFHLTHVKNLEGILTEGKIRSDGVGSSPQIDISSADNREVRRDVSTGSITVAGYVPFFLTPDAHFWEDMRSGIANYRLSEDAHLIPAFEFVILVSSVGAAGPGALLSDGDAADPATRFSSPEGIGGRMARRLDDEEDALRSAEFLVPDSFPFSEVTLIGVANDKVRARVRDVIGAHGFAQKVSVYPPWFQRP